MPETTATNSNCSGGMASCVSSCLSSQIATAAMSPCPNSQAAAARNHIPGAGRSKRAALDQQALLPASQSNGGGSQLLQQQQCPVSEELLLEASGTTGEHIAGRSAAVGMLSNMSMHPCATGHDAAHGVMQADAVSSSSPLQSCTGQLAAASEPDIDAFGTFEQQHTPHTTQSIHMAAVLNSQGGVNRASSSSSSAAPHAVHGMGCTASDDDQAAYNGALVAHLSYAGVTQQPWPAKPSEHQHPSVERWPTNRPIGATAAGCHVSSCSSADMPLSHLVMSAHSARTASFDHLGGMQLIDQQLDQLFRLKQQLLGKTSFGQGLSAERFYGTIGSTSITTAAGASDVQATGLIAADLLWQIPSSVECMWLQNSNQGAAVNHYQPGDINIDIPVVPATSLSCEAAHLSYDSTDLSSFATLQHQYETRSETHDALEDPEQQLQQLLAMRQTQLQLQWELAQLLMSLQ